MKLKYSKFSVLNFIKDNLRSKDFFKVNILNSIFLMSKGFTIESILLYSLNLKNYKNYLPDSIICKVSLNSNNGYWPIFHDKFVFYRFIKDKLPTPELLGLIFGGEVIGVDSIFGYDELLKGLAKSEKYVLKPLQGGGGRGILFLSSNDGALILQDKSMNAEMLKLTIKELNEYGIFKFYHQHDSLAKIYPGSVNTIRMVTLYDFEQKKPFIYMGLLRIGWAGSAPFDNFHQGGLVSSIDIETGILSFWKKKVENGTTETGSVHPDTNQLIEGTIVPHWDNIKNEILLYLNQNPIFNYIGWDILVTNENFVIIEANHNPGMNTVQVHKPYLVDPRAALFFKKLKIYEK